MTDSSLLESDLRPYQTHILLQSARSIQKGTLDKLIADIPSIVNHGVDDEGDHCVVLQKATARSLSKDFNLAWLIYQKTVTPPWARDADPIRDTQHHLVVLTSFRSIVSVVTSDRAFVGKLSTAAAVGQWTNLRLVSAAKIERALVHGPTRTLWLSGIHRSVATKVDSKVLTGSDVEASLDALGDQSFHYTSTRCSGPENALPSSFVGVTPRAAKVWLGPSSSWEVFLTGSQLLLELVERAPNKSKGVYPVLARESGQLSAVKHAFDVSLAPPEYLYESDPQTVSQLEDLMTSATMEVVGGTGASFELLVHRHGGATLRFAIALDDVEGTVTPRVTVKKSVDAADESTIGVLLQRKDLLKIFYESMHTYSDSRVFEVKTRAIPFDLTPCDFKGFDITQEKPVKPAANGTSVADLSSVGSPTDRSLFSWVWRRYKNGWLWCDDAAGEFADFLHLDSRSSTLSLIHVKAAASSSPTRLISVSAYEVVCAQALKNLRYTERGELLEPLTEKIRHAQLVRGWFNGAPLKAGSPNFIKALRSVRYSELKRNVVIVQPHVRVSSLPTDLSANNSNSRRALLLYTLLHAVSADVNRYGVEFQVLAAK